MAAAKAQTNPAMQRSMLLASFAGTGTLLPKPASSKLEASRKPSLSIHACATKKAWCRPLRTNSRYWQSRTASTLAGWSKVQQAEAGG